MTLGIYGTGGAGREIYMIFDVAPHMYDKWDEIVFIDDINEVKEVYGCKVYTFNELKKKFSVDDIQIIIAVGEPKSKKILYEKVKEAGYKLATIISPLALVSRDAIIKEGVLINENVSVSAGAVIEENVLVNGKTIIGHDVHIEPHCQISSFSIIGGKTNVGEETFIGMSSCIKDHIIIGEKCVISMGAVVMKNVNPNRVVMGNPAREIAENTGYIFK